MAEHTEDIEALMRRSLGGDTLAYAELLRSTSRLLRPYLSKRLNFTNEVDDVL